MCLLAPCWRTKHLTPTGCLSGGCPRSNSRHPPKVSRKHQRAYDKPQLGRPARRGLGQKGERWWLYSSPIPHSSLAKRILMLDRCLGSNLSSRHCTLAITAAASGIQGNAALENTASKLPAGSWGPTRWRASACRSTLPCRLHKAGIPINPQHVATGGGQVGGEPAVTRAQVQHPLPGVWVQKPHHVTAQLRDISSPAPIALGIPTLLVSAHGDLLRCQALQRASDFPAQPSIQ